MTDDPVRSRLDGLDLARFFALAGMVAVNFDLVATAPAFAGQGWSAVAHAFQGRAAAMFVVLAGLGLGLAAAGRPIAGVALRRAAFLFAVGMANALIFPADILHFYAAYFVCAIPFLRAPGWASAVAAGALTLGAWAAQLLLDYDSGWDWTTLDYVDFWTVAGFLRNTFYNGWHPVAPWLAFLLVGLALARTNLGDRRSQRALGAVGAAVAVAAEILSDAAMAALPTEAIDAAPLLDTASIPPGGLYMLAAGGAACAAIGLCLLISGRAWSRPMTAFVAPVGRATLTLYVAHILLGMGAMEAVGALGRSSPAAAGAWTLAFMALALMAMRAWPRGAAGAGPLEWLMRRVAG